MATEKAYDIWHAALASRVGIVITTNDPVRAKSELYAARKASGVADFNAFSVVHSPTSEAELWIVRKDLLDAAKKIHD